MNRSAKYFVGICLGLTALAPHAQAAEASAKSKTAESQELADIATFTAVMKALRENYVDQVNSHQLMQSAIEGMIGSLDPHSEFLDRKLLQELSATTRGRYGGLGVEVVMMDRALTVIAPIDGSPAARARMKAGDVITHINGQDVAQMRGRDPIEALRGPAGSRAQLRVQRAGASEALEFELLREVIRVRSVESKWLEPGYGFARVSVFQENTGRELRDHVRKLQLEHEPRLRGLVLDLRDNPGGVVDAAVELSDLFLDSGEIVRTEGRMASGNASHRASAGDVLAGVPIVVLVNEGSASAAEIVAGALQDHRRAVIVGQRTFGKGSVQNVFPLRDGNAIKLTTARYFTPSGRSIQASGIQPDIVLDELDFPEREYDSGPVLREESLGGHLNAQESQARPARLGVRDAALQDDAELLQALHILKGMAGFTPAAPKPSRG